MGDNPELQDPDSSVRVEITRNGHKLEPEQVLQPSQSAATLVISSDLHSSQ